MSDYSFKVNPNLTNAINLSPSFNAVVADIRKKLSFRSRSFQVEISSKIDPGGISKVKGFSRHLLENACKSYIPFLGHVVDDYLIYSISSILAKSMLTKNNTIIEYIIEYKLSYDQEQIVDRSIEDIFKKEKMNELPNQLSQIKAIYTYITHHVSYDSTLSYRNIYDALTQNKAVCEGCSALLFKMLKFSRIPCKIITGKGKKEDHAWNIIKLGSLWFNSDVTWDLCNKKPTAHSCTFDWFLKGEKHFMDHKRDPDYSNQLFKMLFPTSPVDYEFK